jgi:hypothetical protein
MFWRGVRHLASTCKPQCGRTSSMGRNTALASLLSARLEQCRQAHYLRHSSACLLGFSSGKTAYLRVVEMMMWGCSCEKRRVQRRSLVHFKLHRPTSGSDMYLAIRKRSLHDVYQYQKTFAGSHRFCNRPPCCCNNSMICKFWGMTACSYRDIPAYTWCMLYICCRISGYVCKVNSCACKSHFAKLKLLRLPFPKAQRMSDNPWKCRKVRRPEGRVISDR